MHTPNTSPHEPAGWTDLLETTQGMVGDSRTRVGYTTANYLIRQLNERTDNELHDYVDFGAGRTFHDLLVTLDDDQERIVAEVELDTALNENGLATKTLFSPGAIGYMDKQRLGSVGENVFGPMAIDLFLKLPLAEQALCEAAITAYQLRVRQRLPLIDEHGDPTYMALEDIMRTKGAPRNRLMARTIGNNLLVHGVAALRYQSDQDAYDRTDAVHEKAVLRQAAEHALSPDNLTHENIFTTVPLRAGVRPDQEATPVDTFGLVQNALGVIWRTGQPHKAS